MEPNHFCGFIITYNRVDILPDTINKLSQQTLPLQYLLIVDNSDNDETAQWYAQQNITWLHYYKVGYNSGAAGGAYYGLKILANKGYKWIYWGDDNDPPLEKTVFEYLLKLPNASKTPAEIGILGGKGCKVNVFSGRTKNLTNKELKSGNNEVDYIAGGQQLIVKAEILKNLSLLPSEKLFFSFEDLDFCLKVKSNGYKLLIDSESWLRGRGNTANNPNFRWKGTSFGKEKGMWRQYYSTRNILIIYSRNGMYLAVMYLFVKFLIKALMGFKYGTKYGVQNFKIIWFALSHFLTGRSGRFEQIHQH